MTNPQVQLAAGDLTGRADFQRGQLFVSPSRRLIGGPAGERKLQPQVMRVLLCLMDRDGEVVLRRTLFDQCWSGTPVGEDSLNRVLMSIRRGLAAVGAEAATIETIPGSGYRFSGSDDGRGAALDRALEEAFDCWRTGAPGIHAEEIATLERLAVENPSEPRLWGRLALLLRKAAEYADAADCAAYVARCERAARRAFELEPEQSDARVAMAGLAPIFGAWADTREQLLRVLSDDPDHVPARHDLAVLEMATGRLSAASPLMARLIAEDSFAATYHYKRMYHHWSEGDVAAADRVAARALQLWPQHPAICNARYWILLFTGRADQALQLISGDARPLFPAPMVDFLAGTARQRLALDRGDGSEGEYSQQVARCMTLAARGPAQAVGGLMSLCALHAIDQAFEVAQGYFLHAGATPSPLRRTRSDPPISDQTRRVTQPLFIPAGRAMREDGRFMGLCEKIGLVDYWDKAGVVPDFLRD